MIPRLVTARLYIFCLRQLMTVVESDVVNSKSMAFVVLSLAMKDCVS